jgi:hypothetical protein
MGVVIKEEEVVVVKGKVEVEVTAGAGAEAGASCGRDMATVAEGGSRGSGAGHGQCGE